MVATRSSASAAARVSRCHRRKSRVSARHPRSTSCSVTVPLIPARPAPSDVHGSDRAARTIACCRDQRPRVAGVTRASSADGGGTYAQGCAGRHHAPRPPQESPMSQYGPPPGEPSRPARLRPAGVLQPARSPARSPRWRQARQGPGHRGPRPRRPGAAELLHRHRRHPVRLIALVLGFIASSKAKKGTAGGRGLAIGGIVTGLLGLIIAGVLIALGAAFLNSDSFQNLQECVDSAATTRPRSTAAARSSAATSRTAPTEHRARELRRAARRARGSRRDVDPRPAGAAQPDPSPEVVDAFVDHLGRADRTRPGVRCVVLTGAGPAFSAGGDVTAIRERRGMFGGGPAELRDGYRHGIQRIRRPSSTARCRSSPRSTAPRWAPGATSLSCATCGSPPRTPSSPRASSSSG